MESAWLGAVSETRSMTQCNSLILGISAIGTMPGTPIAAADIDVADIDADAIGSVFTICVKRAHSKLHD